MKNLRQKRTTDGTVFECHAPKAKVVCLAGTFNNWDPAATLMDPAANGTWRTRLHLPAGRHEYKFVVDGHWCCEPGSDEEEEAPARVPNLLGTSNCVIEVP